MVNLKKNFFNGAIIIAVVLIFISMLITGIVGNVPALMLSVYSIYFVLGVALVVFICRNK